MSCGPPTPSASNSLLLPSPDNYHSNICKYGRPPNLFKRYKKYIYIYIYIFFLQEPNIFIAYGRPPNLLKGTNNNKKKKERKNTRSQKKWEAGDEHTVLPTNRPNT